MNDSTLDERFGGGLVPDAMLPSQFFGALRGGVPLSGERRLMVAVLEDALHCFQKYVDAEDPKQRQLFQDAEAWITGHNPTWFFSFPNVCDTLDIDPDYVREGLLKWRDAPRRGTSRVSTAAARTDDPASEEPPLRRASGG
jgi:hypothetical protein